MNHLTSNFHNYTATLNAKSMALLSYSTLTSHSLEPKVQQARVEVLYNYHHKSLHHFPSIVIMKSEVNWTRDLVLEDKGWAFSFWWERMV